MSDLQGFGVYNNEERMAPAFRLPDISGKPVSLWDYKQRRAVVLYFLPQPDRTVLQARQREYQAYQRLGVEMLVIISCPVDQLKTLAATREISYPVLADQAGQVYRQYLDFAGATLPGELLAAVFVADRFGAVSRYAVSEELAGLHPQILAMLEFLGNLCNP